MAPQIFITGVTGYVGGQLLHSMIAKHPDYQITGLVRTREQEQKIISRYPSVRTAIGDLNSANVIIEQSKQADVVLQTADADHLGAITSIVHGLSLGKRNGAFIQLSGAASILDTSNGLGQPTEKVWDDIKDFDEISTFDEKHFHAASDQLVRSEGKKAGIRTVVLAPPVIYGKGEGIKQWSMGLPWRVEISKKRGMGFAIGEGKTIISSIHVKDTADVLLFFAEQALASTNGKVEWGERGFYFVESGENVSREIHELVAEEMVKRDMIKTAELESLTGDEANELHPWASIMYGSNMRVRGSKLRALGWTPEQPSILATVSELLE
ncbi:Uncharacterized protein LSUE1_G001587 [Lachnellula suecica]|uniref:Semialdehyde dehydrogenase NAD-binding domain-containing protein n=1 Tax=Lachnellula suecica TaxID=602035 RepID=A0A8T9C9W0_9HELO|nr:Uncharacterized protein LSUE1_G001587 [Lachnellula suecica]